MHRVKVRVVEDALDANNTIARANRDDFDRHGVAVVNLMSAPGQARPACSSGHSSARSATASASACWRATCRGSTTRRASPRCTCP